MNTSFSDYVVKRTMELSSVVKSGVASSDPTLAALIAERAGVGGQTVNMPYWKDLTGEAETVSDTTPITFGGINAAQDVATVLRRAKGWKSPDIAAEMAGSDPAKAIATLIAEFWNREYQRALFKTLDGIFANNVASNSGDLVLDVTMNGSTPVTDGTENLNKFTINRAAQKLGDAKDGLVAIAMHSMAETRLNEIGGGSPYVQAPANDPAQLRMYNGRSIIMDDGVPYNATTGLATVYLFGAGAVAFNAVPTKTPFETGRDIGLSADVLRSNMSWISHVRGIKWKGTPAGASATNTELATAGNWQRVYEQKAIRVIKLICKIPQAS